VALGVAMDASGLGRFRDEGPNSGISRVGRQMGKLFLGHRQV
jgi:hypothetical protein